MAAVSYTHLPLTVTGFGMLPNMALGGEHQLTLGGHHFFQGFHPIRIHHKASSPFLFVGETITVAPQLLYHGPDGKKGAAAEKIPGE